MKSSIAFFSPFFLSFFLCSFPINLGLVWEEDARPEFNLIFLLDISSLMTIRLLLVIVGNGCFIWVGMEFMVIVNWFHAIHIHEFEAEVN